MKIRLPALTMLIFALAACAGTPARSESAPAPTQRPAQTISVPANDSLIAQRLRQSLTKRGWTLIRYQPASLQSSGDYAHLARQAHYRLTLSTTRIGACRDDSASFLYNVALIENASGHVRIALTGANCIATVVKRFEDELDRKQLTIQPGQNTRR